MNAASSPAPAWNRRTWWRVTDKMARSILGIPQIANAQGTPRIVLDPVKNETRFPINKDIFLTRIRAQLNSKAAGKVMFLARDRMEALEQERNLKRAGAGHRQLPTRTVVEFKGADFFLTGTLQGITTRTSAGTSDYILYAFQLIDARTSDIVWEGFRGDQEAGAGRRGLSLSCRFTAVRVNETFSGSPCCCAVAPCCCRLRHDGTHEVALTGNIMVDGPNAIANGPPRDRVLWEYRTAAAAMRQGNYAAGQAIPR